MLRINTLNGYGYGGVFSEIAEKVSEKVTPVVNTVAPIFMRIQNMAIIVTNSASNALSPSSLKEMGHNAVVNIAERLPTVARKACKAITIIPQLSPKKIMDNAVDDKKEVGKVFIEEIISSCAIPYMKYANVQYYEMIGWDYMAQLTDGYITAYHATVVMYLGLPPIMRYINHLGFRISDLHFKIIHISTFPAILYAISSNYTEISAPMWSLLYYMPSFLLSKNTPEVMDTVTQAITSFVHVAAYEEYGLPGVVVTGVAIGLIKGIAKVNKELYQIRESELFLEDFNKIIPAAVIKQSTEFIPRYIAKHLSKKPLSQKN